ncbi:hypothetical protein [Jannaschia formosa]|nr:hypothetical protein [Jannaschia formosa]
MTTYDIAVPLIALAIGVSMAGYVRWASIRLDRRLEAAAREKAARKD